VVITKIILGAKKSSVKTTKTLSELTNCSGVSGDDSAKFIVGIVTDSAPKKETKVKSSRKYFIIYMTTYLK
jgi:hypothetical protein